MNTNNKSKELQMNFDLDIIEHLGSKMYPTVPAAIAELIANSYDACSLIVQIKFFTKNGSNHSIEIIDEGTGMNFEEINKNFLMIGQNRRKKNKKNVFKNIERIVTGKKGLGKLALFGIGKKIDIETSNYEEQNQIKFSLIWEELQNWYENNQNHNYNPKYEKFTKRNKKTHGTKIIVSLLKRQTLIDQKYIENLAINLAKMFTFFGKDFKATISLNNEKEIPITNELGRENTERQFEWDFPENDEKFGLEYAKKNKITGKIFTTPKPIPTIKQRGIALFANGRLINKAQFYGNIESSHFFSYVSGYLNVNFIDNFDEDLISTDRHSINWKNDQTTELKKWLKKIVDSIHQSWRKKRKEKNVEDVYLKIPIKKWLATLPKNKAEIIEKGIEEMSNPDLKKEKAIIFVEKFYSVVPEYAEKHWRFLHKKITDNEDIEKYYKKGCFYEAGWEAVKLYIQEVKKISKQTDTNARHIMENSFGKGKNNSKSRISLTSLEDEIDKNIQEGHKLYSIGLIAGFRNPLAHETKEKIKKFLFKEKDFLDILSLISHLFRRLEDRKSPK